MLIRICSQGSCLAALLLHLFCIVACHKHLVCTLSAPFGVNWEGMHACARGGSGIWIRNAGRWQQCGGHACMCARGAWDIFRERRALADTDEEP